MRYSSRRGILAAAVIATTAGAASAQEAQVFNCLDGQNYCDFVAAPGFLPDPLTSTGLSGGPEATPDCGNIDGAPDHSITLTQPFAFLRIYAESAGDVTLVVDGPFGRVCSDDAEGFGLNPEIARDWPAGSYRVWVGDWQPSWSVENATSYTLHITEFPREGAGGGGGGGAGGGEGAEVVCPEGRDMFCNFRMTPGFLPDPVSNNGISGGPIQTPDCGNIDTTPDHVIEITQNFAFLRAHVESQGDVTLVVQGPFGRICSDDVVGLLPEIARDWPAGSYQVWIGDFGGGLNYTLFLTEYPREGGQQ